MGKRANFYVEYFKNKNKNDAYLTQDFQSQSFCLKAATTDNQKSEVEETSIHDNNFRGRGTSGWGKAENFGREASSWVISWRDELSYRQPGKSEPAPTSC